MATPSPAPRPATRTTCTRQRSTARRPRRRSRGLTNDVEYTCTVTAHNANGDSDPSAASAPFTPTASEAQFSMTIDTSEGGVLLINPEGPDNLGTTGKIKIPPQPGPATEVVVTASLFGIPGETDATCGGNVCIGQGIEWSVSNPSAIKKMRVKFIEAHDSSRTAGAPRTLSRTRTASRSRTAPRRSPTRRGRCRASCGGSPTSARGLAGHAAGGRERPEGEDLTPLTYFGPCDGLTSGLSMPEAA